MANVREILASSGFFACFAPALLDEMAKKGRITRYRRGDVVFRQGDRGDSMLVLLAGSLKITNVTPDGKDVVLGFLREGAVTGEIAVLDGGERTANASALEDTEALVLHRRDIIPALEQNPATMLLLLQIMCGRLRSTNALLEDYTQQTRARVASGLLRLADQHGKTVEGGRLIDLNITQRDLGSHLGLTRETISRTLSELRELEFISLRGDGIVITDEAGLKDYC